MKRCAKCGALNDDIYSLCAVCNSRLTNSEGDAKEKRDVPFTRYESTGTGAVTVPNPYKKQTEKKNKPQKIKLIYGAIGFALIISLVVILTVNSNRNLGLSQSGNTGSSQTASVSETQDSRIHPPVETNNPLSPTDNEMADSELDNPHIGTNDKQANPTIVLSEFVGNIVDYRKVPFASATASSEVHFNGKVYWASNAIDGDLTTSWQEEAEGDGIGEYLIAYFDGEQDVNLIRLRLGYASYYERNGRPKTLRFDFSDNSTATYEFADINQDFYLRFDKTVHTSFIKLTIIDAYTGSEWADTCITEVTAYQLTGGQGNGEQLLRGNSTYIGFVDISSVTGKYCVQCGSFATNVSSDYAENYAKTMVEAENELGNSLQVYVTVRNDYYAVCLGPFESKEDAVYQRDLLATLGYNTIVALYK